MSRAKVIRRSLLGLLAVVVVLALVTGAVVVTTVRDSLPRTSGESTLPGLEGNVSVLRDGSGIPHIYGDTMTDLARAQGYVHAQERFFEMDLRRHITAGRLAELVGEPGLETDKVIRTMGWRKVAEEELPTLKPETRQMLQAYADGVNTYLRGRSSKEVALEYTVLGINLPLADIEDWTPVDSLSWLKAMAWDLRGNYDDELARARLNGRLSPRQIAEIYPAYDSGVHPPILSRSDWSPDALAPFRQNASAASAASAASSASATSAASSASAESAGSHSPRATTAPSGGAEDLAALASDPADAAYAAVQQALAAVPQLVGRGEGVGSNSWVVSGARTTTGKPLIANDPHLGVSQPGIWIQNSLHCRTVSAACPLDVSGFSFSGVPGVVIGHNGDIAWAFTNLGPDVSDFYLERVVNQTYLRDGAWQPLATHEEVIKVAGQDDVRITVRATGHGPLMSDVLDTVAEAGVRAPTEVEGDENDRYAVSLAWTGLLPGRTADAILDLNKASTFEQFREAARSFAVPAQNLLYADREGHIGYQAPGQVPIRRAAIPKSPPGYWPAPGWNSAYDWKGFVRFEDLPWVLDPKEGVIVAANQQVADSSTPFLTTEWDAGWRSTRIGERLAEMDRVGPQDMADLQMDDQNPFAKVLVPTLLGVPLGAPESDRSNKDLFDFTDEARELLRDWDYTTPSGDSPQGAPAAYYNAVWRNLLELLFDDELPSGLKADGGARWRAAVQGLLADPDSAWWDNKLTPNVTEGKDEILRQALVQARLELTKELGKNPENWQWGKLHRLELEHPVLGGDDVPGVVRWLFNDESHDMPGGSAIVNANGWDASVGYEVDWAPSMRMVVDLSDLDASTWITQTGVSGHPTDDHYSDQVGDWVAGRQRPWPFSEQAVRDTDPDVLTLRPENQGNAAP